MYHRLAVRPPGTTVPHHYVSPSKFTRHCRAIARFGFASASLPEAAAWLGGAGDGGRRIVLTFDDGYANFAHVAAPTMERHGLRGTVFVVTGLLASENDWDWKNGDVRERLMTADQVRAVATAGHEVGSHTVTHARLTEVTAEAARQEIELSRDALTDLLAQPVATFCYPYGAHDAGVRQAVADAGYKLACSVEKGWNDARTDALRWTRINVRSDTSTPVLFWKLWRQAKAPPRVD